MSIALINFVGVESVSGKKSLRKCINAHCKSCVHDPKAAGTWLAQVTLCPVTECKLYSVRPTTDLIPASVYEYYGEEPPPESNLTLKTTPEGRFSEKSGEIDSSGEDAT